MRKASWLPLAASITGLLLGAQLLGAGEGATPRRVFATHLWSGREH